MWVLYFMGDPVPDIAPEKRRRGARQVVRICFLLWRKERRAESNIIFQGAFSRILESAHQRDWTMLHVLPSLHADSLTPVCVIIFLVMGYTVASKASIKTVFLGMGILVSTIRWSRDCLILNMGIYRLVRQHLHIETPHTRHPTPTPHTPTHPPSHTHTPTTRHPTSPPLSPHTTPHPNTPPHTHRGRGRWWVMGRCSSKPFLWYICQFFHLIRKREFEEREESKEEEPTILNDTFTNFFTLTL